MTAEQLLRQKEAWIAAVQFVNGTKLRVVGMIDPPFVNYLSTVPDRHKRYGPGIVMELLAEIGRKYNIGYEFVTSSHNHWGDEGIGGHWNGMTGLIQRGEADMIAGAAFLRHDRSKVVDYSIPFIDSVTGMLIRAPNSFVDNAWLIVTKPFHWKVWALIFAFIILSGFVLSGLTHALRTIKEVQYNTVQSIWVFFSVFVQQELPIQPRSWAGRTFITLWWLSSLVLVATFTGNMVAMFTVQRVIMPIKSPETLLSSVKSGYTMIMVNTSMTRTRYLKGSKVGIDKQIWLQAERGHLRYVKTLTDGVEQVVSQPDYVLLAGKENLEVVAAANCKVMITDSGILPVNYGIVFAKYSKYKLVFDKGIRDLVEMGMVSKWHVDYQLYLKGLWGVKCAAGQKLTSNQSIDIEEAQGAFRICGYGVGISFAMFLVEVMVKMIRLLLRRNQVKECRNPTDSATNILQE